MSVGSNVVKLTAKTALRGNLLRSFTVGLILAFTWGMCVNFAGLLSIVTGELIGIIISVVMLVFLCLPVALGALRYIWRTLFSVTDNPISIFYWFSEKTLYIRAIKFILQFVVRIAVWLAVLNIPSLLLYALSKSFIFELVGAATPVWTANLGYYSVLLMELSLVVIFFIMLKFYMAPLLFVADENMDINEAMYRSSVISRKSSIDFVGLIFSSFGWILLSVFVLPLPFTIPLLFSFYAVHIRFSVAEYNRHIEESKFTEAGFI